MTGDRGEPKKPKGETGVQVRVRQSRSRYSFKVRKLRRRKREAKKEITFLPKARDKVMFFISF